MDPKKPVESGTLSSLITGAISTRGVAILGLGVIGNLFREARGLWAINLVDVVFPLFVIGESRTMHWGRICLFLHREQEVVVVE